MTLPTLVFDIVIWSAGIGIAIGMVKEALRG